MITEKNLFWGGYGGYEGWCFLGDKKIVLPPNPTTKEKELYLGVSTEGAGGCYNPFNGYDSCGWSVGGYQLTELCSGYEVSQLLSQVQLAYPDALSGLVQHAARCRYDWREKAPGIWRFYDVGAGRFVDQPGGNVRKLMGLRSNGRVGSWDAESKVWSANWAVQLVNVWDHDGACEVQRQYLIKKIRGFVMPASLWLFDDVKYPETPVMAATRAGFLTFALNRPATADAQLTQWAKKTTLQLGTYDYLIGMLRQLTFGPNIAIYPARLLIVERRLAETYGIPRFDFQPEIKAWKGQQADDEFDTTTEIQTELVAQGYDLGPRGVDGVMGKKTTAAVRAFQISHGLEGDGVVGPRTRAALVKAKKERREKETLCPHGCCRLLRGYKSSVVGWFMVRVAGTSPASRFRGARQKPCLPTTHGLPKNPCFCIPT